MLVYVLNKDGEPLMPCSPRKARLLLRDGKAKVIQRTPFTIKLLYGSTGYKQIIVAGMDTGSKVIGCAAIAKGEVVYQSETSLRQAVAICCEIDELLKTSNIIYKKHIAKGDYQQTSGSRSEKKIPTGKLFGLRKFDLIKTPESLGFIKGKPLSGYFALMDITGSTITDAVNIKKGCVRLSARTTTIISRKVALLTAINGDLSELRA